MLWTISKSRYNILYHPFVRDTLSIPLQLWHFVLRKPSRIAFFDPRDESVAKEGILRQFVKYMLILSTGISFHTDGFWRTSVSFRLPVKRRRTLFITTQIEVPFRLPANENQNILPLRSKDWTFPDETILFGAWNNIVWGTKHKCLTSETILFER